MSDLPSWPRPHFVAGAGNPLVSFYVFGDFPSGLEPSREKHRVGGVPEGLAITGSAASSPHFTPFLEEPTFKEQLDEDPALGAAVRSSKMALVVQGELADQPTLDYLRDAIGIVCAALDAGGVAVLDMQRFKWWSADDFRETFLEGDGPDVHQHTVILASGEEDGRGLWFHTRGMRTFGRPDLSAHHVTEKHQDGIVLLFQRLIEMMALGGLVPDGQPVKMAALPAGLTCHHGGDLEDHDFNNVHIEIRGL